MTAQLFSSNASNTPEVMVICLLSNTTTPISSIGLVTSDILLNPSGKALFFTTSGNLITNWAFFKDK